PARLIVTYSVAHREGLSSLSAATQFLFIFFGTRKTSGIRPASVARVTQRVKSETLSRQKYPAPRDLPRVYRGIVAGTVNSPKTLARGFSPLQFRPLQAGTIPLYPA